jgi:thiol-disulfide isomerase/thioredoxin
MSHRITFALLSAIVVAAAIGCSGGRVSSSKGGLPQLETYPTSLLQQYYAMNDSGYQLLQSGRSDEAIAVFVRQTELIPAGRPGAFNVGRAYSVAGNVDESLKWLERSIVEGWQNTDQLERDPGLEAVRKDPRFAPLAARIPTLVAEREAAFTKGLPEYDEKTLGSIGDAAALKAWSDSVSNVIVTHGRSVWHNWQFTTAAIDYEAKQLAVRKRLAAGDPSFDYGLERVRSISRIRSPQERWGGVTKGVLAEVDRYLAQSPNPEGAAEAHYHAGVAILCEQGEAAASSPQWSESVAAAKEHFDQIPTGSRLSGASAAWLLWADIAQAGDATESLAPRVREFVDRYKNDRAAMDVAGGRFQRAMFEAMWPIPFDAVDLDSRPVSLDQYRGKVVLLDFWATWCGPCRQELPHLRRAFDRYRDQGFEILSVSLDFGDRTSVADYRAWIEQNGMAWRHVYDQKGWQSPLVTAFGIEGIPFPILIGRDGKIAAMQGECRGSNLERHIEAALAEAGA